MHEQTFHMLFSWLIRCGHTQIYSVLFAGHHGIFPAVACTSLEVVAVGQRTWLGWVVWESRKHNEGAKWLYWWSPRRLTRCEKRHTCSDCHHERDRKYIAKFSIRCSWANCSCSISARVDINGTSARGTLAVTKPVTCACRAMTLFSWYERPVSSSSQC